MKSKKNATKKADISRVTRSMTKNKQLEKGNSKVLTKIEGCGRSSDMDLPENINIKLGRKSKEMTTRNTQLSVIENVPENNKIIETNESRMRTRYISKSEKENLSDKNCSFEKNKRKVSTRDKIKSNDENSSGKIIGKAEGSFADSPQQVDQHNKVVEFAYEENDSIFISSDFVWAKLRGHPIWPAKVSMIYRLI